MKHHYIAILTFVLGTIGANVFHHSTDGSDTPTASTVVERSDDRRSEVPAAFDNLRKHPFLTVRIENENRGASPPRSEIVEYLEPNRSRRIFLDSAEDRWHWSMPAEVVEIGSDSYVKRVSGEWIVKAHSPWADGEITPPQLRTLDFKYVGEEIVDGNQASVFSFILRRPDDIEPVVFGKVWIHSDKWLPIKSQRKWSNGLSQIITYDLDTPVKPIEVPKKVRDTSR